MLCIPRCPPRTATTTGFPPATPTLATASLATVMARPVDTLEKTMEVVLEEALIGAVLELKVEVEVVLVVVVAMEEALEVVLVEDLATNVYFTTRICSDDSHSVLLDISMVHNLSYYSSDAELYYTPIQETLEYVINCFSFLY